MKYAYTHTFKIAAFSILVGFIILSLFSLVGPRSMEGDSLLSCIAKSAGAVSCNSGADAFSSVNHEISSFQALTGFALAIIALALTLIVSLFTLSDSAPLRFAFSSAQSSSDRPILIRLRRWLSLFESSPGR